MIFYQTILFTANHHLRYDEIMKTHKQMTNQEIAKLLKTVAAAYEIKKENRFKISAYQNAASSIEQTASSIKDLWEKNKLTSIPGIGKNIASHLDELFKTGKVKHFNDIFKDLPQGMFALMDLSGIGSKTAHKLSQQFKLTSQNLAIKQLKKLAKQKKIQEIEGFGQESEQDILRSIKEFKNRGKKRMLLPIAQILAQNIINYLKQSSAVLEVKTLGSLRRQTPTVGDIDLAVATKTPQKAINHFLKYPEIKKITDKGDKKISVKLNNNQQIDIRFHLPQEFGSLLQHFTGSKAHNVHLRQIAKEKNLSLSEYGIKKHNKLIKFPQEQDFYKALNMAWIPPELREDQGEIQAAQKHQLPDLVELSDIKGDLHIHTDFFFKTSHDLGIDSMKSLVKTAKHLKYQYLGFADHNPSQSSYSSQQMIDILKKRKQQIEEIKSSHAKTVKINILNLLEVDIKPDGSLAIPDKALDQLDFAIAAIHSSFKQNKETITKRVLTALSHPKVKIFAHPASRKLNHRPSIDLDWDKIFDFCQKNHKILEINSFPQRLDLPDDLVRQAIKQGVKLVINTDAHSAEQMKLMSYGISVARRGWAEPKDIINTLSFSQLKTVLNI